MSKLLDKLQRASQNTPQPMGFGAAVARAKTPSLILISALLKNDLQSVTAAVKEGAEAMLLPLPNERKKDESLDQIIKALGEIPWGVTCEGMSEEETAQLKELGCDFLAFGAAGTPLAVLQQEGMDKVLTIDLSLESSLIRTIEQLPIDAVLIDVGEGPPLTVHQLMMCQRVVDLIDQPLLAKVPFDLTSSDLEGLREVGVVGIVVEVAEASQGERIGHLRQLIDALPSREGRPRRKSTALLPSSFLGTEEPETEIEEDE